MSNLFVKIISAQFVLNHSLKVNENMGRYMIEAGWKFVQTVINAEGYFPKKNKEFEQKLEENRIEECVRKFIHKMSANTERLKSLPTIYKNHLTGYLSFYRTFFFSFSWKFDKDRAWSKKWKDNVVTYVIWLLQYLVSRS